MTSVQNRLDTLTAVRTALPHVSDEDALRVAEWALTGSHPINPTRIDTAAQRLASGLGWDWHSTDIQNKTRGLAQTVVAAYMASEQD